MADESTEMLATGRDSSPRRMPVCPVQLGPGPKRATVLTHGERRVVTPVTKSEAKVLQVLIDVFRDESERYVLGTAAIDGALLRERLPDVGDPGRHLRALRQKDPALWGPVIVCPEDHDAHFQYGLRAGYVTVWDNDSPI
jgi:hypothetical protein